MKNLFLRFIGFIIGGVLALILMAYLTWGTMGYASPGDLWGLTRFYSALGGLYGAFIIGDVLIERSNNADR